MRIWEEIHQEGEGEVIENKLKAKEQLVSKAECWRQPR